VARVFVDTNVLFPFSVMDLMLALTEDAVHEVGTPAALSQVDRRGMNSLPGARPIC
jgi:hypothetical protein